MIYNNVPEGNYLIGLGGSAVVGGGPEGSMAYSVNVREGTEGFNAALGGGLGFNTSSDIVFGDMFQVKPIIYQELPLILIYLSE